MTDRQPDPPGSMVLVVTREYRIFWPEGKENFVEVMKAYAQKELGSVADDEDWDESEAALYITSLSDGGDFQERCWIHDMTVEDFSPPADPDLNRRETPA